MRSLITVSSFRRIERVARPYRMDAWTSIREKEKPPLHAIRNRQKRMDGDVIRCPSCGQANRVPSLGSGKKAVCGKCKAPLTSAGGGGHPIDLTDASFRGAIGSGRFVVDFWAAWCGPCRMIAPVLEQIAAERDDVRVGKLNVDENPRTAAQFGVQSIPLLVFFRDGEEAGRLVGAHPKGNIEAAIRRFLG
jgi:thioredoxin